MDNHKKRLISLVLAAMMFASLLPAEVSAAPGGDTGSETASANLLTEETKQGVVITGLKEPLSDGTLEIPEELYGKKVYRIEEGAFKGVKGLKRIIIPASVSSIGDEAFCDCSDLLNAEFLGEAPNQFGKDVFLHCAKDFAMWHHEGKAKTYCVLHGYPYYFKPQELTSVYHSFSGKTGKNEVKTVSTNVTVSDALFEGKADRLNYDLARLSLCFAMASSVNLLNGGAVADVVKYDSMVGYDTLGAVESMYNRPDRFLRQCLETAGFENDYYQYRYSDTSSEENDEAYGVAWKRLDDGSNMVVLVIRSNGYGGGWVSNVTVSGADSWSRGFYESARNIVYGGTESRIPVSGNKKEQNVGLLPYLEANGLEPENTRIWVTGFSRGGAVANCIGGILQSESDYNAGNNNLLVYTFATPRTVDEDTATLQKCPSVFNIVQEMDLVPQVPLEGWGFKRFGITYALPCRSLSGKAYTSRLSSASEKFSELMQYFDRSNEYSPIDGQEQIVDEVTKLMYAGIPAVSAYQGSLEESLQSVCSVLIAKNPGDIDTDALISYLAGEDAVEDLLSLYRRVIVNREKLSGRELADYARRMNSELEIAPLKAIFSELSSYVLKLLVFNKYDRAVGWLTGKEADNTNIGKIIKYASNLCTQGFDSEALIQHWPEEYYSWLNSGSVEETLTARGYKRYCGKCPIDITVYDASGAIVAQIINEQVTVNDLVVLTGLDGEKTVIIPEDQHYRVETVSREDSATMDVTVERCTLDGDLVQKDIYLSVPLTQGETFTAEVTPIANPDIVNDAGETLIPDRVITENEFCIINISSTGDGTVIGGGAYVLGDTVSIAAIPDDGSTSLGWYDEDGKLISTEDCLKFTANGNRTFNVSFVTIPEITLSKKSLTLRTAGSKETLEAVISDESWRNSVEWIVTDLDGNVSDEHPQSNDIISVNDEGEVTFLSIGTAIVVAQIQIGEITVEDSCRVSAGIIPDPGFDGNGIMIGSVNPGGQGSNNPTGG